MKFINDIARDFKHLSKAVRFGFKTLPTVRDKREIIQRSCQHGYEHGYDLGLRKARMYHPGADTGVLHNDWLTQNKTAISVIRDDFKTLCARSELAYRTDPAARRAVGILSHYMVGQGNQPYPAVKLENGDMVEGINGQLARDWERFNDQGVRNGNQQLTIYQFQLLKCITEIVYGSVLQNTIKSRDGSLLPYSFQALKPTRLDFSKDTYWEETYKQTLENPIIHGIQLNKYGEATSYYFENESGARSAKDIDLTFYPIETEQYLGLPWLTPVLPAIWDRQQLVADKLSQSRIGARLGMHMPKADQEGVQNLISTDSNGTEYFNFDFQGLYFSDKKPTPIAMTDPISTTFQPLMEMIFLEIALGLGFSGQKLTSIVNSSNFSSPRINVIDDNKFFRILWRHFINNSCRCDWNRFVDMEVMTGRLMKYGIGYQQYLSDPWYYNQCYWLPRDGEDWIDPLKDAQALILLYKSGQITYQELCTRQGKSYKSVLKQLQKEREEITSAGLESILPENISASAKVAENAENVEDTGSNNASKA